MVGKPDRFTLKLVADPNVVGAVDDVAPVPVKDPSCGALALLGGTGAWEAVTGELVVDDLAAWVLFDAPKASGVVF